MRIVCTSDWHGDWSTLGHRRHDEVAAAVDRSVDVAVEEKADAYLCLGDVSDPDTGGDTFRTIELVLRTALSLRERGIRSIWVAGNHDVCEDGSGASTLTPLRALEDAFPDEIHVASSPRLVWLDGDVAVLCLPFTPMSHGVDAATAAASLLGERGLPPLPRRDGPLRTGERARVVVAGHLMLPGIHPGGETTEMPRGREVLFPLAETRDAFLRLNGHYHARQIFDAGDGGPPIYIPGSLARLNFGEEGNEPSILVLDVPPLAP